MKFRAVVVFDYESDASLDPGKTPKQIAAMEAEMFNDEPENIDKHLTVGNCEVYVKPLYPKKG